MPKALFMGTAIDLLVAAEDATDLPLCRAAYRCVSEGMYIYFAICYISNASNIFD